MRDADWTSETSGFEWLWFLMLTSMSLSDRNRKLQSAECGEDVSELLPRISRIQNHWYLMQVMRGQADNKHQTMN